ncbi:MAG: citrate synthase/methylcitrate synthase [Deltaproteobacteria bacterium]|nr:citrate synthase/methylcitrate synthase [Deltaproteobacteria bacterium]
MESIARGLAGVVAVATRISHVDGAHGVLTLGGYPVEEIAPRATYEEAVFLLWHGRLPRPDEADELHHRLATRRWLPAGTVTLLHAAAVRRLPIMDALRMAVDTLQLDDVPVGHGDASATLSSAIDVVARVPTIVATYVRLLAGRPPVAPDARLRHAANYLAMLRGEPAPAEIVRALETYLVTVIDHGLSASTFAARVVVSTRSDMLSAMVGALGAFKGPLHGGAPGPALEMVFRIRERAARSGCPLAEEARRWTAEALAGGERLMGFGHRVYSVRDPRAEVLAAAAARLFERGGDATLHADARTVEAAILEVLHHRKPGRRIETNVEFYTALVLHGVGLEPGLFTPTFAVSRVGGWTAHVLEQIAEDTLLRPSSTYVGEMHDHYIPAEAAAV